MPIVPPVAPLTPAGRSASSADVQEIDTAAGPRWFEWEERAVLRRRGRSRKCSVSAGDITEGAPRRGGVPRAQQAVAANRAKSRFLAAMSHGIRTPMDCIP